MFTTFYHYTSGLGVNAIKSSGYIMRNPPGGKHAHFGPGTYGTSIPPSHGMARVAWNNWLDYGQIYIDQGKVDYAIQLEIPSHLVKKVSGTQCHGRDILVHDDDIRLEKYPGWKIIKVPD